MSIYLEIRPVSAAAFVCLLFLSVVFFFLLRPSGCHGVGSPRSSREDSHLLLLFTCPKVFQVVDYYSGIANDMFNNDVGKGGTYAYEAYEAK
jgi:hypothetical protein